MDQCDIRTGATHIERNAVVNARHLADTDRTTSAANRAGKKRTGRELRRLVERHDTAIRSHNADGSSDPLPFDTSLIDGTMLIAEVIAKPEVTPLLEAARVRGAQIHSGIHMIHGQVDLIAAHMAEAQAKV